MEQSEIVPFDWQRILMDQYPGGFLLEVVFRALVIFLVVMISLRITGKRGVKQLSLFELVFILTLGSAGGDVIFYEDVPLVPVIVTFAAIIGIYFVTVYFISRNEKIEKWMEGEPLCIIENGHFVMKYIERENFSPEEVCMELRIRSVEHIGQVKSAILETSGEMSVFFYPDEDVRPGMPTLPWERQAGRETEAGQFYACARCGNTEKAALSGKYKCVRCDCSFCMKALSGRRIG
ncbi:uncharacterized membrane protein YcaP (DUF421 family) [Anseongella ginsenosidimutans]|uniref:Uncharacterized membrane protein YcaP (DUF421 family) n=1 Tax=Anseongella ginsenosidimutans TaxID=496056 RepID=A0A4R3KSD8_9SPHI|nr:YetF domain-containing protein [Anseongella ginsenosidimutans]QEC53021.1 DUF421 domain-containing protein [Anseongella ginsenosidimutans]TCS87427.1 uncharacterized membrane protein YcaP (DUF421 family) [Anseongella ginsenosidimutans]